MSYPHAVRIAIALSWNYILDSRTGKVDKFVNDAGLLLGSIGAADLAVLESVPKADAGICIDRLNLLVKTCWAVANALQTCICKAEATEFKEVAA